MKGNRVLMQSLGTAMLLAVGLLLIRSVSRADLPQSTATQIYQPSFDQWAFLSLTASYRDYSGQPAFVSIERQSKNGGVRFKVLGRYTNDRLGKDWYARVGSRIRTGIEDDCKRWTAEGYPISLNDFDIDIAAVRDERDNAPTSNAGR
jgi:hypothetical protein